MDEIQSRDAIRWAYRLLLGREPESDTVVDVHLKSMKEPTCDEITAKFIRSREFSRKVRMATDSRSARLEELVQKFADPTLYEGEPGFFRDCFGIRTRVEYLPKSYERFSGGVARLSDVQQLPVHDDIEIIAVLETLTETTGAIVAMELGAGWGPWVALVAKVAHRRGVPYRLIAVEGFTRTYNFLKTHLTDNEIDPASHAIIKGLAGPKDGPMRISRTDHSLSGPKGIEDPARYETARCFSIASLLADEPIVDILHCDIQGAEAQAFAVAIDTVTSRVRNVVIGTHSRQIEDRLFHLFSANGWVLRDELPCKYRQSGHQMTMVHDGVQVWKNPAL